MSPAKLEAFIRRIQDDGYYNDERKNKLHQLARLVLLDLVKALGYPEGSYTISHYRGQLYEAGEITLRHSNLYVKFMPHTPDVGFMWRTYSHRRDMIGGDAVWTDWARLRDMPSLAKEMHAAIADLKAEPCVLPVYEAQMPSAV